MKKNMKFMFSWQKSVKKCCAVVANTLFYKNRFFVIPFKSSQKVSLFSKKNKKLKKHIILNVLLQNALQLNGSFCYFWKKQQRNLSCSSALLIFRFAQNRSTEAMVMFRCQKAGQIQPEAKVVTVRLDLLFLGGVAFTFPTV